LKQNRSIDLGRLAHTKERIMDGQIVKYSERLQQGVIRSADGALFRFKSSSIRNLGGKLVGTEVDFLVESRQPRDIFLLQGSPWMAFGLAR
jgi:hypothetical protein